MIKQVKNLAIISRDRATADLDKGISKMALILKKYSICSLVVAYSSQECIVGIELRASNIINQERTGITIKDNSSLAMIIQPPC